MRTVIVLGIALVFAACGSEESTPKDGNASGGTSQATGGEAGAAGEGGGGRSGSGGSTPSAPGCIDGESCRLECEAFGKELDSFLGDNSEVDPNDPPVVVQLACEKKPYSHCYCVVESGGICWELPWTAEEFHERQWEVACPGAGGAGGMGGGNARRH